MIQKLISYCENLAEQIIAERYLDKESLSFKIGVIFQSAFTDILNGQLAEKESERNRLWRKQEFEIKDGKERQFIQQQLIIINSEIKRLNKTMHLIQDFNDYQNLKKFVEQKFGCNALQEFYKTQTRNEKIKQK